MEKELISKDIDLNGTLYGLRAAIEYNSSYFKAHIIRNNKEWQTYDDLSTQRLSTENSAIILLCTFILRYEITNRLLFKTFNLKVLIDYH